MNMEKPVDLIYDYAYLWLSPPHYEPIHRDVIIVSDDISQINSYLLSDQLKYYGLLRQSWFVTIYVTIQR